MLFRSGVGEAVRSYEESSSRYLLQLTVCEDCFAILERNGIKEFHRALEAREVAEPALG